jgi:hypothetical protein
MKSLLVAIAVLLSGCATERGFYTSESGEIAPYQVLVECEYEASKVAAGIRNGIEAGFVKEDMFRKCLAVKGYRRR